VDLGVTLQPDVRDLPTTGHWSLPLLTKIYIDTVEKSWDFLLATLKNVRN